MTAYIAVDLEALASGRAIAQTACTRLEAGAETTILNYAGGQIDSVTARHAGEAARAGDEFARNVGDLLLESARVAVRQRVMSSLYCHDCPIVPAQPADDAGLLGALAMEMYPA